MPCQAPVVLRLTHASTVRAVVVLSDDDDATCTRCPATPENWSPPPYLPATQAGPFWSMPLLPLPEVSVATVPEASSKRQSPTRPGDSSSCPVHTSETPQRPGEATI